MKFQDIGTKSTNYINHTASKGTFNSYLSTVSYLPAQQVIATNKYVPQPKLNKFKKNKRQLKTTQSYLLDQTNQKNRKFCMKYTPIAYIDNISNSSLTHTRRQCAEGVFKRSLQHRDLDIINPRTYINYRSVEDFGVDKNRLKIDELASARNKRNPITRGQIRIQKNNSLQKIWKQDRRIRDHGQQCKKTLQWNTNRKKSSYAQIYKLKKVK